MRKVFGVAGLLLTTAAGLASEARPLTDKQMDTVTAGYIVAIPISGCDATSTSVRSRDRRNDDAYDADADTADADTADAERACRH